MRGQDQKGCIIYYLSFVVAPLVKSSQKPTIKNQKQKKKKKVSASLFLQSFNPAHASNCRDSVMCTSISTYLPYSLVLYEESLIIFLTKKKGGPGRERVCVLPIKGMKDSYHRAWAIPRKSGVYTYIHLANVWKEKNTGKLQSYVILCTGKGTMCRRSVYVCVHDQYVRGKKRAKKGDVCDEWNNVQRTPRIYRKREMEHVK